MYKKSKIFVFLEVFLVVLLLTSSAQIVWAKDHLRLSFVVFQNGQYIKPFRNEIVIYQQPTPFSVEIKNVSDWAQKVYRKGDGDSVQGLQFEVTQENGSVTILKRKKRGETSGIYINRNLMPEKSFVLDVLIDHDEWENVVIMEPNVKYKVRAIYLNQTKKIYSDYYTVILRQK